MQEEPVGEAVINSPYGDGFSRIGFQSPYYNQSHVDLRKAIRKFIEEQIKEEPIFYEENKVIPLAVYKKSAD